MTTDGTSGRRGPRVTNNTSALRAVHHHQRGRCAESCCTFLFVLECLDPRYEEALLGVSSAGAGARGRAHRVLRRC